MVRRAEKAQAKMRLGRESLLQCRGDAGFADTGFARNEHDLAVAGLGARPAAQQQVDLLARPTSGVNVDPRKASNRLSTALGRNTRHASTGPAMPFTSTTPRSR